MSENQESAAPVEAKEVQTEITLGDVLGAVKELTTHVKDLATAISEQTEAYEKLAEEFEKSRRAGRF